MQTSKSIILCMPADYGISKPIVLALTKQGFNVYEVLITDATYKYKNIFQRLNNLIRKVVFKDYKFKENLKMESRYQNLIPFLNKMPNTQFALFIRPDLFPIKFVEEIRLKADKIVGYQWDGLDRFPRIYNYIKLFDRFFVFDHHDADLNKGILPTTNFYIPSEEITTSSKESIYFIASFDTYRFELMNKLKQIFDQTAVPQNISFITKDKKALKALKEKNYPIIEKVDYNTNLSTVKKSSVLVDLVTPFHSGLSFRIFEALYYNKKLITNNKIVSQYDFYHPNNIFIWDGNNENEILTFLNLESKEIEYDIKKKYSLDCWIKEKLE